MASKRVPVGFAASESGLSLLFLFSGLPAGLVLAGFFAALGPLGSVAAALPGSPGTLGPLPPVAEGLEDFLEFTLGERAILVGVAAFEHLAHPPGQFVSFELPVLVAIESLDQGLGAGLATGVAFGTGSSTRATASAG